MTAHRQCARDQEALREGDGMFSFFFLIIILLDYSS